MAKAIIVVTLEERDGQQIIHVAHRDGILTRASAFPVPPKVQTYPLNKSDYPAWQDVLEDRVSRLTGALIQDLIRKKFIK